MSSNAAIAGIATPIRKYELGRPIIRREQRVAFEAIHRDLAQTWSDSMAEYLPHEVALEFEGFDFEAFSSLSLEENSFTRTALFSITGTPVNGFFMISAALARFLVSRRLGMHGAQPDAASVPFTRIEAAIARETARAMLARLGEAYAAAGLGSLCNIRECDDLVDSFIFAPEESLALLKFRMRGGGEDLQVLVALSGSVVGALTGPQTVAVAEGNGRNAIVDVVRRLPIEVEVVLGSWKVSLSELLRLRAGDKIVLPGGEDAWLAARGIRLYRAGVEVTAAGASVEIRKSARLR